ncbi:MAG TPA: tRNA (adenosine(37)-N6)-dimethylallyltransferase MiaA, partial [Paraburkholderia sp.]
MMDSSDRTAVACVLGPTASGKTAAALAFAATRHAQGREVEIVSIDSALVYREMDIGTAKPSAAERAAVVHHLIDIVDPADTYSAADFRADALRVTGEILARGNVPLLVGGTMLYYRALTHGLSDLPSADPAVRAALDADAARDGWPALHARLASVDPATAARLAPNDSQRIQRALEIFMLSGQPMSALLAASPASGPDEAARFRFVPIALEPSERAVLHERIARRFDAMLAAGFIDEVKALRARGDLHA